ncbi:hypothetical protein CHCC20348_3678 [Bacillus paralicheniformis]|nr:hypothetical protein CHCC20348_3678 [Bacillus paralicheniformis]
MNVIKFGILMKLMYAKILYKYFKNHVPEGLLNSVKRP